MWLVQMEKNTKQNPNFTRWSYTWEKTNIRLCGFSLKDYEVSYYIECWYLVPYICYCSYIQYRKFLKSWIQYMESLTYESWKEPCNVSSTLYDIWNSCKLLVYITSWYVCSWISIILKDVTCLMLRKTGLDWVTIST